MSTLLYIGTETTEKRLIKAHKYRAYLAPDQKKEILEQLKEAVPDLEKYIVTMHVEIDLKLYDTKDT